MDKIRRFEELAVWQKSRVFTREIHSFFRNKQALDQKALSGQIIRSSASVMDNVAEGFERGGNKEFIQYLWIAKASAGESRSQLYRALDIGVITAGEFERLKSQAESLSAGIYKLIATLKASDYKGQKYASKNQAP